MDWDQIESKWAAMTRRVRADWSVDNVDVKVLPARRALKTDEKAVVIVDRRPPGIVVDARLPLSVE